LGVENFIEGTFLSWYLDIWDAEVRQLVLTIIKALGDFDTAFFATKPDEVVDYLKNFYQEVFPKQLRHDLGEFYTPDWLAEYITKMSGFDGEVSKRVIDPACGSGTFLISILNKVYERNRRSAKKEELIKYITNNVVGFDINPVAVLTARTNYLISLTRFNFQRTTFTIPVYLTDSIVLPELAAQTKLTDETNVYHIKTTKGVFSIPQHVKSRITQVMHFLKQCLERSIDQSRMAKELDRKFDFEDADQRQLGHLYSQLLVLSKKNP